MNQRQLPRLRFGPQAAEVSLNIKERHLLQGLFDDCQEVLIEGEFGQGNSSTRVLLVIPARKETLARQVVKLGPMLLVDSEWYRHKQYVAETLPMLASQVTHTLTYQDLSAIASTYIGGPALGPSTVSLADYYHQQPAAQIRKVLDYLLQEALGQSWYAKRAAPSRSYFFQDFYSQQLPGDLILNLAEINPEPLSPEPDYPFFPLETPAGVYAAFKPGQQVHLAGFQVEKQRRDRLDLIHPDHPTQLWVNLEPTKATLPALEAGQPVHLRGQVVDTRQTFLSNLISRIFPMTDETKIDPTADIVYLAGIAYSNPLQLYPTYLKKPLPHNLSTIHGDLHTYNILVDQFNKAWLIDFGRAKKGHTLFDFVELEAHLRHIALGEESLTLIERVDFEQRLACTVVAPEQSVDPPTQPDLAKAFTVIQGIRDCAADYLAPANDFHDEYFPALFLYLVSMLRHLKYNGRVSTQHMFIAATVLGAALQEKLDCQAPTAALTLTTPALEQYLYFLQDAADDDPDQQANRHQKFLAQLQRAADTLSQTLGLPAAPITWQTDERAGRHRMVERYSGRWQNETGQIQAALMAYELNDTYLLRLVVYQEGTGYPPQALADLRQQFAFVYDQTLPEWLGQSFFYTGQSTAPAEELAQDVFQTTSLRHTSLACGELYTSTASKDIYLLICATPEQDKQAGDFFNHLAPKFAWYSHKVERQVREYETYLHGQIEQAERVLIDTRSQAETLHKLLVEGEKDFDTVQAFHAQISQLELGLNHLANHVTQVNHILNTVKINLDNYAWVTDPNQTLLKPGQDNLFAPRRGELNRLMQQIESDLGFPQRELDQARHTLAILRSVAERFPLADYDPLRLAQAIQNQVQSNASDYALSENLTIMFDDIKDSTAYAGKHGDQQWHQLVQRHDQLLKPIINRYQGRVIKSLGDGSLSIFPGASGAVQAALKIQQALHIANQTASPIDQLHIRLGIHTGPALLSTTDVLGLAVSLASRVCGQADAGEIVISEATYKQAGDLAANFEIIGERKLKGIEKPQKLYRKPLEL